MCNFVPGEAVAIGPMHLLSEIGGGLPGDLQRAQPLISEVGDFPADSELAKLGTVVLRTEPGLELYAVSRLSARLSAAIEKREAVVDLNHILPLSAALPLADHALRFSPHAEREVIAVRRLLRSVFSGGPSPTRVAVLDSGLSPAYTAHREIRYFDYTAGGRLNVNTARGDPLGHGTRVVHILDQLLPPEVEVWVGRVPEDPRALTALVIAQALGDLVARGAPEVVNLSLTPRNDWFVCPSCKQRVPAPTFLSALIPLVVRMAGKSVSRTFTVMAAGNAGQIPNSRWLTEDVDTLLFAVAENRKGERARYSGAPDGPHADLFSAGAFGGDDPDEPDSQGVFLDGVHGTSFAAPFISAMTLLTKRFTPPMTKGFPSHAGDVTRRLIETARGGGSIRLRSSTEQE
jgi:Subtilase family